MQPVSHGHQLPPPRMHQAPPPAETDRPGKSAQSVGHQAKAAVAAAQEAGIEVPKNAQGLAASQIANGADPASVFAAQIEEPPVGAPDAPAETAEEPAEAQAPAAEEPIEVSAETEQPPEEAAPPADDPAAGPSASDLELQRLADAEAALELLTGGDDPET